MKQLLSKEKLEYACSISNGVGELIRNLNLNENGATRKTLKEYCKKYNIQLPSYTYKTKYKKIDKQCPVCGNKFSTLDGHDREKTVCSHSCSNTFFRSGENNPNYKNGYSGETNYRIICFENHKKECIICGFNHIVEVHHVDCDKENNDPLNLVPLCPNHHRMFHSRYRLLVEPLIEEYLAGCGRKV